MHLSILTPYGTFPNLVRDKLEVSGPPGVMLPSQAGPCASWQPGAVQNSPPVPHTPCRCTYVSEKGRRLCFKEGRHHYTSTEQHKPSPQSPTPGPQDHPASRLGSSRLASVDPAFTDDSFPATVLARARAVAAARKRNIMTGGGFNVYTTRSQGTLVLSRVLGAGSQKR